MAHEQPTLGLDFSPTTIGVLKGRREPSSVLTTDFAGRIYAVTGDFHERTLVASLVAYSDDKRKLIIQQIRSAVEMEKRRHETALIRRVPEDLLESTENIARLEARIVRVEELAQSPASWQGFMGAIVAQEKRGLMAALGSTLGEGQRFYTWQGLESNRTVGDLRQVEVGTDFVPASKVDLRRVWISLAFRGT
ncbi:MAG: hypothetical protein HYW63_04535 [Candidatus Levybacteria bacterium]|nr:hypothetical protein [Candidatus Levybacteria bacterium]